MDVLGLDFPAALGQMIDALTRAHFVAIDFELSGIASKQLFKQKVPGVLDDDARSRKQSLQQRYEEAKEAAEKYQILQVGITIVEESDIQGDTPMICYAIYAN